MSSKVGHNKIFERNHNFHNFHNFNNKCRVITVL